MDPMLKISKLAQKCKHIQKSLDIVEEAFANYNFEKTCISFNGGKDCTAVLHLVHSFISKKYCLNNNEPKLVAFYAQLPNHFEEEEKFVRETINRYNLKLMQYSSGSLKEALHALKSDAPQLEAIFIGTRRDDFKPGTHIAPLAPTDNNWPKFMRINPITDWSYAQVWDFIRALDIPYCDLYNQGYSSLGTRNNTTKNSSLLRYNELAEPYYLPAWHLPSSHEERLSRSSSVEVHHANDKSSANRIK